MSSGVETTISVGDAFTHMRIINGMGISLCLSRLLIFIAKFIQNPKSKKVCYIHIGWIFVAFLMVLQFWWEYLFHNKIKVYLLDIYIIDLLNVFFLFFVCVLLTPEDIDEYGDYANYFLSRKVWLFSLFIVLNVIQLLNFIGPQFEFIEKNTYFFESAAFILDCVIILFAMRVKSKAFQYFFLVLSIASLLTNFVLG